MMTLTQTERLVRRITDAVSHPTSDAHTAKLAQDYTELCRAANRRLEQCALMIEAGQFLQALQLAETAPALLDIITLLTFRQSGEWRAFCQQHHLPSSEPFYDKYIRLLNDAYGKGINSDHPFYKDYRRAIMENNDARAFSILRVIAKLNPSDNNTKEELKRLEDKLLRGKLDALRDVVASGDPVRIQTALDQLDASGLPVPASHPAWQQAQIARCRQMIRQAEALRAQGSWKETEMVVEDVHGLASRYNLRLPEADADSWADLEEWSAQQRTAYVAEQNFRRAVSALEYEESTVAARRSNRGSMPAIEASAALESLGEKWTAAERFKKPLPEELAKKCQATRDWLQSQIRQSIRRKRLAYAVVTIVVVGCIAVATPHVVNKIRQVNFDGKLAKIEAARDVSGAVALTNETARAGMPPSLADGVVRARSFLAREEALKQTFDSKMAVLQRIASGGFSNGLDQIAALRADCQWQAPQLAPDYRTQAKNALAAYDAQWQAYRSQMLEQPLSHAEEIITGLNASGGPDPVRASIEEIKATLTAAAPWLVQPPELPGPVVGRLSRINKEVDNWTNTIANWVEAKAMVPGTSSLEEYLKSLDQLVLSPFASQALKADVARIGALSITAESLLGQMLIPNDPTNWSALTTVSGWNTSLMPEQPTSQEKDLYFKLRDDKNLSDVNAYELQANPRPGNRYSTHTVFVRGAIAYNNGGDLSGMVDDPLLHPDILHFAQTSFSDFDFIHVRRLQRTLECDSYERLGLGDIIDSNTGNYQKPILQLLDGLNNDTRASAVFRAYVTFRLLAIARLRPVEWGVAWCPGVAAHVQALTALDATEIQSGDWMVPERSRKYEARLQAYFDTARATSLEKQARFFQQLVRDTCSRGFLFAGFVGENGQPVLRPQPGATAEIFGWNRSGEAVLLFRRDANSEAYVAASQAQPYSPLFVFTGNRRELLRQAMKTAGFQEDAAKAALPPFFGGLL